MFEVISIKVIANSIAVILTFIAFIPYIRTILSGDTKPHVFSWVIWSITTIIVFFAQLEAHAGIGAWSIGLSGLITLFIAFLAYIKKADLHISRVDWLFFVAALSSLPLWYFSANPLWAVVILTSIDILGFGPTIRKAYDAPFDENISFFILFTIRNGFAIIALEHYSTATVLFPAAISIACILLILLIVYRRHKMMKFPN